MKTTIEQVKEIYEKKYKVKIGDTDLTTPKLLLKYIEKYPLSSDAEIKLLNTPELVEKYIEKYRLFSASAEIKLLNTPELVEKYIEKHRLFSASAEIIFSLLKSTEERRSK